MIPKDVLVVNISDMHSGGTTALFPGYQMTLTLDGEEVLHPSPTEKQKSMFAHWLLCARWVKQIGKGKRLLVVHNGDAIEGNHHGTIQIITPDQKQQSQIHIELMDTFLKESGFSVKNGDELHYTSGTESHTGWEEYGISAHYHALGAKFHIELKKEVNGRELWWTHHGAGAGKGANEGNGYRNWLRDIYFDCLREEVRPPSVVVTAHFHKSLYQTYVASYRHTIHGMILPSWQMKTRYAYRVAPFQRNDIGLSVYEVTAGGDIRIHGDKVMP